MSDKRFAFCFTWKFVGHGVDDEDAFDDVMSSFEGLTTHNTDSIECLGPEFPDLAPWAIYSPHEQAWWNDDTGWGDLASARRFTGQACFEDRDGPHLITEDAMYVRIGGPE